MPAQGTRRPQPNRLRPTPGGFSPPTADRRPARVHVLVAIVAVGPVAVAASMFPSATRARAPRRAASSTTCPPSVSRNVYAAVGLAATVRLAMFTGVCNLLWGTVTVLMIVRPGSTTGA
ncbi:hypothetical protein GCM10011583_69590 [Streptomyces camponoticapitis]|uniref:Integral membrane protein n=1 Tax=Streptomyces camponoticapitis TaxID=1616125 RepID=A0ABQ2EZ08_9ACTN|nr:hypothetical protein GCM10011583_69590 [Streptomyces camponoticapitis]